MPRKNLALHCLSGPRTSARGSVVDPRPDHTRTSPGQMRGAPGVAPMHPPTRTLCLPPKAQHRPLSGPQLSSCDLCQHSKSSSSVTAWTFGTRLAPGPRWRGRPQHHWGPHPGEAVLCQATFSELQRARSRPGGLGPLRWGFALFCLLRRRKLCETRMGRPGGGSRGQPGVSESPQGRGSTTPALGSE